MNLSQCPIGSSLDTSNGICICDPKLKEKLKGIECRISYESFKLPPLSWMSRISNEIIHTSFCNFDYCLISKGFISLDDPNDQCLYSRSGIACGQCAEGLSTVFGTSKCKKYCNVGLFIIPVLAVVGVILVIMLFMLNLTVVNGNINGFIFLLMYLALPRTMSIFDTKKEVAYVLIVLSNLDLGIEICFYDGMTAYVATWLQFIFPLYLLLIVLGLVMASRYISRVEKITCKKVIPVIATLYLLSCNKIMMVTFRGLFSYMIGYLYSGKTELHWSSDTEILVPSTKFILLSIFCAIVLLFLVIPTSFLLLFTKRCYEFNFVVNYFKPFIDATKLH